MSIKFERLTAKLKRDICTLLQREISDPRLGFITVTGVELAKDLKRLRVMVSVLGNEGQRSTSMHALNSASGHLTTLVARGLRTRQAPRVEFVYDEGAERSVRIGALLERIKDEGEEE